MIFNFTTHVKKGGRLLVSIPYIFCKKYGIKLGDVVLAELNDHTFFGYISGTVSSKKITVPLRIFQKLPLGELQIKIKILQKRKPKLLIVRNKIDLYQSLPNRLKHFGWPLAVVNEDNYIKVWSPQAHEQVFPRYLELNEELFEVFGLYQGEGYKKTPVGGTRVNFVNSNVGLINKVILFFQNIFEISPEKWSAFINYVGDSKEKLNRVIIDYWSQKTNIPVNNFKRVNYLKGKGIKSAENGTLHIFIPSCVLGEVCLNILEIIEKLSLKNKQYASWFLRGIMAADGSATLQKYKSLRIVELALENDHEKYLYTKIFERLCIGIKDYSLSSRKLGVSGWDDFFKLAQINVFKLHDIKRDKFLVGLSNHKQTRMVLKYLLPLLESKKCASELVKKISVTKGSLHATLNVNLRRGFITKIKENGKCKYYLTEKGYDAVSFFNNFS